LNAAVRDGLIGDNPARRIKLPPGGRILCVDGAVRVGRWRDDGTRPPVAVDQQPARGPPRRGGLRRGEAAGLRWCDLDLDRRRVSIVST